MPRPLTPDIRERLGLSPIVATPYRWSFMVLVVATASVPMALAGLFGWIVGLLVVVFAVVPGIRWYERREALLREQSYRHGDEAVGRVLDVEPAGPGRVDRTVRIEFWAEESEKRPKQMVRASVTGSRLARRGLAPGDDVLVVHDRARPTRCFIVERIKRESPGVRAEPARAADSEIVDAIFEEPAPPDT